MLTERQAARLARRAHRQGSSGVRRRAERAYRRLCAGALAGDRTAMAALAGTPNVSDPVVNAVWAEWIARPGTDLRTVLEGWHRPASREPHRSLSALALHEAPPRLELPKVRAAVIDLAAREHHPLAEPAQGALLDALHGPNRRSLVNEVCAAATVRRELVPFCLEHGLVPADEIPRAAYFAITGQPDEHRAIDPDGSLLASAYRSAGRVERGRIRDAVIGYGDADLVRALVGADRRDRLPNMSADEITDLAGRFADRREYEELWGLTTDVSVSQAVELIRLFGNWQPDNDPDRGLFHRLRATSPDLLAVSRDIQVRVPEQRLDSTSIAPDRQEIALPWGTDVRVLGLPQGDTVAHYEHGFAQHVLHLGDAIIVDDRDGVVCHVDGRHEVLDTGGERIWSLEPLANGFLAQTDKHLLLATGTVDHLRRRSMSDLARISGLDLEVGAPNSLAVDRVSGRFAVIAGHPSGDVTLAVVDTTGRTLARADQMQMRPRHVVTFCGRDVLITADGGGYLRRWKLTGDALHLETENRVGTIVALLALPRLGRLIVRSGSSWEEARVRFVDPETLAFVDGPSHIDGRPTEGLAGSADNSYLVLSDRLAQIELYDLAAAELTHLLDRPVASMRPGDLAFVAAQRPGRSAEARELLGLLRACLERRFGAEVQLGSTRPTGEPHDIGLSRGERPAC